MLSPRWSLSRRFWLVSNVVPTTGRRRLAGLLDTRLDQETVGLSGRAEAVRVATVRVVERLPVDRQLVHVPTHELLVGQLLPDRATVEDQITVPAHRLSDAFGENLPVVPLWALLPMIFQHPFCGREFWHDRQIQVVHAEGAVVDDEQWDEFNRVVGRHDHSLVNFCDDRDHGAKALERTSFELEKRRAVRSRRLREETNRIVVLLVDLDGALAFLDTLNHAFFLLFTGSSGNKQTLEPSASCTNQWYLLHIFLRRKTWMYWRLYESHYF